MAKGKKNGKRRRNSAGPSGGGTPKVRVKVSVADADLDAATRLVKPALLYADSVTLYSPAASMVNELAGLTRLSTPQEQLAVTLQLIQAVPALAEQAGLSDEVLRQVAAFTALDPKTLRVFGRATGKDESVRKLLEPLEGLSDIWGGFDGALKQAREKIGGTELFEAIDRGVVSVAGLSSTTSGVRELADAAAAAAGDAQSGALDDVLWAFVGQTLEALTDGKSFPLLDAQTTGLVRALEREASASPSAENLRRGAEISAAISFMGFLPHFVTLPMDEVLDLRKELDTPLRRFRGAVARMSQDFRSRPIDEGFSADAEDAWRTSVEPALVDIREALAEHNLLNEVASVALGDPRRLVTEAGSVLAASMGGVISMSSIVLAGAMAGLPALDVAGRAIRERERNRREVATNSFYFLHRVGEASRS